MTSIRFHYSPMHTLLHKVPVRRPTAWVRFLFVGFASVPIGLAMLLSTPLAKACPVICVETDSEPDRKPGSAATPTAGLNQAPAEPRDSAYSFRPAR